MTKVKEKQNMLSKAWLVSWVVFGNGSDLFERCGIKNKVIDVLGPRVKFEKLKDIAEEYYINKALTLTERLSLQHYTKGGERRRKLFELIPSSSSYGSQEYKDVMENFTEVNRDAWAACPKYYCIGHNPAIEIYEVKDFSWYEKNGRTYLSWLRKMTDGSLRNETCVYEQ